MRIVKRWWRAFLRLVNKVVSVWSLEFVLKSQGNGGGVVFLRTFWMASWIYVFAIVSRHCIDPTHACALTDACNPKALVCDPHWFRTAVTETVPWFGTIFGAIYFALHSRFASQWTYLADLYNQIKAAEVDLDPAKTSAIAQWKAGFIEDAVELHLARKPMFESVISKWVTNSTEVSKCIRDYASDDTKKFIRELIAPQTL